MHRAVARDLLGAGRRHRSIALEADAGHLVIEVWASAGAVVGAAVVASTSRAWRDPLTASLVAVDVVWTGVVRVRRAVLGRLDAALGRASCAASGDGIRECPDADPPAQAHH